MQGNTLKLILKEQSSGFTLFGEAYLLNMYCSGPRSAVSNVSGNRCESDCSSRGLKFDPGPVPYFHGD